MSISFYPQYSYDSAVRERFHEIRFFTNRTGMSGKQAPRDGLEIGQPVETYCTARIEGYSTIVAQPRRKLSLCSIGAFSSCASSLPPQTRIGRFCSIAPHVTVMGWRHPIEAVTHSSVAFNRHREFTAAYLDDFRRFNGVQLRWQSVPTPQGRDQVVIGNDVWIATDVALAPGVTVGDGAVIAARSVVVQDVPPYTIVGGNPARVIRHRFPQEIVDEMLGCQWWDFEYGALLEAGLDFADPAGFLKRLSDLDPAVAGYPTISGVTLEMDVPPEEGILFSVHGTVLRWNGKNFGQDDRIHDTSFALRRNSHLQRGVAFVENDDGTVSVSVGDKFLSPKEDGHTMQLEPHKHGWERFIAI